VVKTEQTPLGSQVGAAKIVFIPKNAAKTAAAEIEVNIIFFAVIL
jgi:hypothetical protein